ncbi:MAG: MarR family transcriptional regulator [Rhizobacter sp.]|jgi:DNA-binding MarR family transcriptional regulator|nr:MarR family transcriptional regulator [Rhizobacter sp.]
MSRPLTPVDFYCAKDYSAQESVGYLMRRVMTAVGQATDRKLEPQGLTHAQWGPLFMMRKSQTSTVAELARELSMDPGAMTRLLDRLEAKGLCKRVRSTEDRRVVNVELTASGEEAADKVPQALSEVLNASLAGFSKTEWQALQGYLKRMLVNASNLKENP